MNTNTLEACQQGIKAWKTAFNQQDAEGCAAQYSEDCIMIAKPIGEFKGREAIRACWQNIIDQGFSGVEYSDVLWTKEGEDGYLLTSSWTMNKAFGVVHKEHWKLQADGTAKLVYDEFEIQGER